MSPSSFDRAKRNTLLVLPLFVVVAIAFSHEMLPWYSVSIPATRQSFDPALQAFILVWDWQSLPRDAMHLFDAPIFHPERRTLTYMDHMVGEAIVGAPVHAATNSIAAGYNFLFLLATILSAWATYRLARLIGAPRAGAWLCGFLFAFSPYRMANVDLLNQLQTQFLPLGLFFALRYLQRWKLIDVVALAGVFVVQVYFGWYYTFFLATALGLLLFWALIQGTWTPPRGHAQALAL
ncbi:MAG TPA: hypothetical protein VJW75_09555, partial [Candidatus Eisenbacteria bacterium]|nr:hypothetical protein [Candidatus Eisenbacteria bacterium]